MSKRMQGVLYLLGGIVLLYLCAYSPLEKAAAGAEFVSISIKGSLVAPCIFILGIAHVILGGQTEEVLGTRDQPSAVTHGLMVLSLVAGFGLYYFVNNSLSSMGYG